MELQLGPGESMRKCLSSGGFAVRRGLQMCMVIQGIDAVRERRRKAVLSNSG